MTGHCEVTLTVEWGRDQPLDREVTVFEACCKEWPFERDTLVSLVGGGIEITGRGFLEEGVQAFTDSLAEAIWTAIGEYCKVLVDAVQLVDTPHIVYSRDRDDFEKWRKYGCL